MKVALRPNVVAHLIVRAASDGRGQEVAGLELRRRLVALYCDWATILRLYKVPDPNEPEPGRATATLFTFRW